jgi:hypothetical protein
MKEKYRMSTVKHRGTWSDRIARDSSQYLILVEELIDINKMTGLSTRTKEFASLGEEPSRRAGPYRRAETELVLLTHHSGS